MRVLILTPDIYTRGGIARYTAALASALGDLIGPRNVHVQPLLGDATRESVGKFQIFNPVTSRLSTASKFRFADRALGMGWRKYNLTVCTHIGLSPVAALMRLLFGTPFWVTCHGSESWPRFPADVRWALRRADLILPVSLFTAKTVSKANGIPQSRMRVLYNAIPDEFSRMLAPANGSNGSAMASNGKEKLILSVGMVSRENAYKGYDTVIKALPKVLKSVPKARYLIAGEGDDIQRLKGLACAAGVQDQVEFKGGIPDAGLAACYRACDVFVLPSRAKMNQQWEGEGFGRVYAEAALAGKPVVGSFAGGAAEAVLHEKTGFLVDPASVSEVADALTRLLRDPELAARMGREGRHWALANFSSVALGRQLAELLGGYGS
jgi:phosphatidyl-myo-inositol dimannoside synthase